MRYQARIVALSLGMLLAPFAGLVAASPVTVGGTPQAQAPNLPIYALNCVSDPGQLDPTAMPPGCKQADAGIEFTVVAQDGEQIGACTTNTAGQCEISALDGDVVQIVETLASLPAGYAPKQNPIPWTVSALPSDRVPIFINIARSTPNPAASASPSPATPTAALSVSGTATYRGNVGRTGSWAGNGPQGKVRIANEVKPIDGADAYDVVLSDGIAFGVRRDGDGTAQALGAWDLKTGKEAWSIEIGGSAGVATPTLWKGVLFTVVSNGNVLALSAATGEVLWNNRALPKDKTAEKSWVLVDDGVVYAAIGVYAAAFDATSGKRLWVKRLPNVEEQNGQAGPGFLSLAHGRLIEALWYGGSYALNAKDGSLLWETANPDIDLSDGDRLYSLSSAFDGGSGDQLWSLNSYGNPTAFPAIALDGRAYFAGYDNQSRGYTLTAIAPASVQTRWTSELTYSFGDVLDVAAMSNSVVIVVQQSGITAVDADSGKTAWQIALPCVKLTQVLGVDDSRIYLGEAGGWIALGGTKGPSKVASTKTSDVPIVEGLAVAAAKDITLVDDASNDAFPVADLKAGDTLQVTGPSVSSEGATWWPVSSAAGDGFLPGDALIATGFLPYSDLTVHGCRPT